jgi:hypothetical protein
MKMKVSHDVTPKCQAPENTPATFAALQYSGPIPNEFNRLLPVKVARKHSKYLL